jgi:FkbM family methyltransferase
MRKMAEALAQLKKVGFEPRTVIDVGVAYGTPDLYEAFPGAYFHLFEPLREFEPHIRAVLKKIRGEHHACALSDESDHSKLFISPQVDGASLMHQGLDPGDPRLRAVEVLTLDNSFLDRDVDGPVLLKTDCQGADLRVIQGGKKFLARCDVVIMEVGMFHFWGPKTPDFAETVRYMQDQGFVPYDFFGYLPRPSDGALGQIDVVFINDQGMFRASHQW